MKQLSYDMIPYKFDYKSKLNMSLISAKHNTDRFKFKMDPTKELAGYRRLNISRVKGLLKLGLVMIFYLI